MTDCTGQPGCPTGTRAELLDERISNLKRDQDDDRSQWRDGIKSIHSRLDDMVQGQNKQLLGFILAIVLCLVTAVVAMIK